ncbi:siderophore ABC transporter substrate-binding protein [Streptomyces anulatus]|uniref:ABC transporter substrate-binding protein n=1 Tax=Streptomyces anulatus TaxID=1892 RepID=A0A7K3RE24_STRAQ|nr:ABC transporter substrate-binding protein [Streptomyces anulatus]NDZ61305.1 ABC transporter substrate-binding protein [Streptomyces anulatus]NEC00306.1 ABC transporter substrate-binding protein [Streptomyces anulatus]NED29231.1 ABC transporter substrate-binding protein [Streptomyces anulatus]
MRAIRFRRTLIATSSVLCASLALGACGDSGEKKADSAKSDKNAAGTVTVPTSKGDLEVPLKPVRVAALDNTSFATLKALGVKPVAVPKGLLPDADYQDWQNDSSIKDAGMHFEPKFEAINAAKPDLIIGGYRFADHHDKLSKIAKTIDLAPSDDSEGGYVNSLKTQTESLGKIFGAEDKAKQIVAALDKAQQDAIGATKGEKVFLGVAAAGKVDNGASRIGRLTEPLNLKNVLSAEGEDSTSVHDDSGLAPETIAKLNPDWLIVLDRDAAVGTEDGAKAVSAKKLVDGMEAWDKTTFRKQDQVIYLANDFYLTEGIQAYTDAFGQVATAFKAAG